MEKKKMTNKKKFWIGMSSLAAVGIITTTVAYFSSHHSYSSQFKNKGYSVSTTQIFDRAAAQSMVPGQTENLDISVTNTGDTPVLARIKYVSLTDAEIASLDGNGNKAVEQTELSVNAFDGYGGINITEQFGGTYGDAFKGVVADGSNFDLHTDGYYYYQGILSNENISAKHLDGITLLNTDTTSNNSSNTSEYGTDSNEKGTWIEDKGADNSTIKRYKITTTYGDTKCNLFAVIETTQATDFEGNVLSADRLTSASAVADAWDKAQ